MNCLKFAGGALVAAVTAIASAQAQDSVTVLAGTPKAPRPAAAPSPGSPAIATVDAHLRARPDMAAPVIAVVPHHGMLAVHSCREDRSWCDVSWGPHRGWIAGAYFTAAAPGPWASGAYAHPYPAGYWGGWYGPGHGPPYWGYAWPWGGYWGPANWGPHIGVGIGWSGYWGPYRRWGYRGRWR